MTEENETREPYAPKPPQPKPAKSIWNRLPQDRKDRINDLLRKAGVQEPLE